MGAPTGPTKASVGACSHGLFEAMTHLSPPTGGPSSLFLAGGDRSNHVCARYLQVRPPLSRRLLLCVAPLGPYFPDTNGTGEGYTWTHGPACLSLESHYLPGRHLRNHIYLQVPASLEMPIQFSLSILHTPSPISLLLSDLQVSAPKIPPKYQLHLTPPSFLTV